MENVNVNTGMRLQGRIDTKVHDVEELSESVPNWDGLSEHERHLVVRDPKTIDFSGLSEFEAELAETWVEPTDEESFYNVTTDRVHQYFVDNLDPTQTDPKDNLDASWMALGNDGGSGTATSDTDLNSRQFSKQVSDHSDNGKELFTSTFVDSSEGNGFTFDEIGLFTGDPSNLANADVFMINHAAFGGITKDSSNTVTFDVTLLFSDV